MPEFYMSASFRSTFAARTNGEAFSPFQRIPQDADATGAPVSVAVSDEQPSAQPQADGCP